MFAANEVQIRMSRRQWRRLTADLARRGEGVRESGAFLLARRDRARRDVVAWIAFDELDPGCLNGAISIRGEAFARLWDLCRKRGLRVIADVHTHPDSSVHQSPIDEANPMVASRGHVAVIVPRFAGGQIRAQDVGFHVYTGKRSWESSLGGEAARRLRIGRRWLPRWARRRWS